MRSDARRARPRASDALRALRADRDPAQWFRRSALTASRLTGVVAIAVVVVVLDQITKADRARPSGRWASRSIIVDGLLALTLVMNPGLAFGCSRRDPGRAGAGWWACSRWWRSSSCARVALRVLPSGGWREQCAIGFIFGGAVGNLIDRARFGAVVDFVDVYWPRLALAGLQRRRLGDHGGRRAAALPRRDARPRSPSAQAA